MAIFTTCRATSSALPIPMSCSRKSRRRLRRTLSFEGEYRHYLENIVIYRKDQTGVGINICMSQ
jgi:hypothetical protein